jgi:selenocysteine-specific elongation factor
MRHVIVGTAGHIDHGKSALVEALTGTHPDRLEEEKRRGITIDLGFAFLALDGVKLGFVDVPGHERFVKNMLAGVGGIDLVLLVIAADESVKPQTREHFDICRLLEIRHGLVALTKCDLVDADALALVRLEVEEFLRGSFLEGAPVVPVSARTRAGVEDLKAALLKISGEVPPRDTQRYFRLPVDRVFAVKGFGTVVTGTLLSGSVRPEDEAEIFPSRRRVRVRGVHSGGEAAEHASAGQRAALNLAGVDASELRRGMTLTAPGLFVPTRRVDARLTLLASARALKSHARVHFHQGTAELVAEVVLLEGDKLAPGESCRAQLRLAEELLLLPGDHFIVRQFSPLVTIGGGVVLDNCPPRRARLSAREAALLAAWERGERAEILALLADGEPGGLTLARAVERTGWMPAEVAGVAQSLAAAGRLRLLGTGGERETRLLSAAAVRGCAEKLRTVVEAFHRENPLVPGIAKEELRRRSAPRPVEEPLFRAALDDLLAARQIELLGELVKMAGRGVELTPEEARAKDEMEQLFARAGLAVPPVKEALGKLRVDAARAHRLLQLLVREKKLVKVTEELIFHAGALAHLRERLADYKRRTAARISVPAFKELAGITRKFAIPLLEYLDRSGVTRREGDERVIL